MRDVVPFVEFKTFLKQNIPNIIYVFGQDEFLKKCCIDLVKKKLNFSMPQLNISKIEELDVEKLIFECNTLPFYDEFKLIIVQPEKINNNDLSKLKSYFSNSNHTTVLVLIGQDKVELPENVVVVDCDYLDKKTIRAWLLVQAKKLNVTIKEDAVLELIDRCAFKMFRISSEIEKLASLVGINGCIELQTIKQNVAPENDYQVFVFADMVAQGEKTEALDMINKILINEKNVFNFWSVLYGHFRRMFFSKITPGTDKQVADLFKVKEFAITKARRQAQKFKATELKNILQFLAAAEENIKSGKIGQDIAIKSTLVNILNTRG